MREALNARSGKQHDDRFDVVGFNGLPTTAAPNCNKERMEILTY